jgi:hypothetical protein
MGEVVRVTLRGVQIEGSAGIGLNLRVTAPWGGSLIPRIDEARDVRIAGGGSYAAIVSAEEVFRLIPDAAARAKMLGNALEGITVQGPFPSGELVIPGGLPWFIGYDHWHEGEAFSRATGSGSSRERS